MDYDSALEGLEEIRHDAAVSIKLLLAPLLNGAHTDVFPHITIYIDETPESIGMINALAKILEADIDHNPKFHRRRVRPDEWLMYGNISMEVSRMRHREPTPKGTQVTGEFWDCHCKHSYIHSSKQRKCNVCGDKYGNFASRKSKVAEVLKTFNSDLISHEILYTKVFGNTEYDVRDLDKYTTLDKVYGQFLKSINQHPAQLVVHKEADNET